MNNWITVVENGKPTLVRVKKQEEILIEKKSIRSRKCRLKNINIQLKNEDDAITDEFINELLGDGKKEAAALAIASR